VITAVDANVVIDLLTTGSAFGAGSAAALRRAEGDGRVVIGETALVEIATGLPEPSDAGRVLATLGIGFRASTERAAYEAAAAWRRARSVAGRDRLVPDFLIGGHAAAEADRLLTRDAVFYRRWFPELRVVEPADLA
jgi:predicted nucleic acid-binding protein